MGRLRNLAQTFHEFATNHVEESDVPAVADGDDGYANSTKIALLLLKEEVNKPLRSASTGYSPTEQVFKAPTAETKTLQFDEISRTPASIRSAILFDALTRDYRRVLRDLDVPLLVCAGADEKQTRGTVAAVRNVADLVQDAEFELFEDSGHGPCFEEPERFNRVVSRFVDSI